MLCMFVCLLVTYIVTVHWIFYYKFDTLYIYMHLNKKIFKAAVLA